MNTKTIPVAIIATLLGAGGMFLFTNQPQNFGAIQTDTKSKLLSDNVEQHTRLKEPPVWDTSIVTSEEMSQAYINTAAKYEVTTQDIKDAGGNIQTAIQEKMALKSKLCNDPTSTI